MASSSSTSDTGYSTSDTGYSTFHRRPERVNGLPPSRQNNFRIRPNVDLDQFNNSNSENGYTFEIDYVLRQKSIINGHLILEPLRKKDNATVEITNVLLFRLEEGELIYTVNGVEKVAKLNEKFEIPSGSEYSLFNPLKTKPSYINFYQAKNFYDYPSPRKNVVPRSNTSDNEEMETVPYRTTADQREPLQEVKPQANIDCDADRKPNDEYPKKVTKKFHKPSTPIPVAGQVKKTRVQARGRRRRKR